MDICFYCFYHSSMKPMFHDLWNVKCCQLFRIIIFNYITLVNFTVFQFSQIFQSKIFPVSQVWLRTKMTKLSNIFKSLTLNKWSLCPISDLHFSIYFRNYLKITTKKDILLNLRGIDSTACLKINQ